ncbi:hypothetical protein DFJ77DRAFT_438376 [Powellomyces hirtus]|nr:hypothetical protein DFJ77DRAFT_438376 [Powellomyces hirtus]
MLRHTLRPLPSLGRRASFGRASRRAASAAAPQFTSPPTFAAPSTPTSFPSTQSSSFATSTTSGSHLPSPAASLNSLSSAALRYSGTGHVLQMIYEVTTDDDGG